MRRGTTHNIAFGGLMAALAVVVMCLIGLIPLATFVCPMICILICAIVYKNCGCKISCAWYGAVALLSIFFAPDKEGALIFLFLGYYPILKIKFDKYNKALSLLYKVLYFNASIVLVYVLLLHTLGLSDLTSEYQTFGRWFGIFLAFLGNICFALLDFILQHVMVGGK